MGRGTIAGGGTDGQYQLTVDYGSDRIDARVAQVDSYIAVKQELIDHITPIIEENRALLTAYEGIVNSKIEAYRTVLLDPLSTNQQKNEAEDAMRQASHNALVARSNYEGNQALLAKYNIEKASLEARKARLQALTSQETMTAWCADLTEDATGVVSTIEVPGEPQEILIAPGGEAWNPNYGSLIMREAMSPEQAYFNAAILPGWQKFLPTWRFGTISNIDTVTNRCTVTLSAATSTAQDLSVNQGTTLLDVPVVYMQCNAIAFEEGDEVVVQFNGQSWENPVVIGFRNNPKPCGWSAYYGSWNGAVHYLDNQQGVERYFDGTIDQFEAYWRTEGGSWTLLTNTVDSADNRKWVDLGTPATDLRPEIEMLRGSPYYNAYLFLRPLVYRAGSGPIVYTMSGVNEFRLMKGSQKLFHYAYQVSNGYTSGETANVVCRPFLVGGAVIKTPLVDEQPLLPHVDDYISGWSPSP